MKSENNRNRTKGNNISQQKELREQQQNLEEFKNDVNKKFVNIEKNVNDIEEKIKSKKKLDIGFLILNGMAVLLTMLTIFMNCKLNDRTIDISKEIATRDYKLEESNQPLSIKEECKLKLAGDDINMSFAIKQGQPIATYLAINNASNNKESPFIKRMYPQIKNNTISMSLPFVSEEDKVKENDIYLRMGTTNQLELIMLDSAGRIQRYYILVEPNVKSANKTEKIEKKVKKVNENGNDSKYYSAGTAELNYKLVTSPNIVFECNLINPETIDNYIGSYKEEASDIKYGEDISGEKIYDNMVKINDLVKTQLF